MLFALPPAGSQKESQPDLQNKLHVEYIIITEMTDAGRRLPEPSFAKPVYYLAHPMEQRDTADTPDGTKQKPIPYSALQKQLSTALAANGYRPADEEHPPTQVLFFEWGTHDKIEPPDAVPDNSDGNSGAGKAANANTSSRDDILARAKFIAGQKFAGEFAQALKENDITNFSTRDDDTKTLVDVIFNGCYYLRVSSCDFEAHKKNRKKLLWATTISTISRELPIEQTLPIMINNAAYFFGRETLGPEIVRKRAYRHTGDSITISEEMLAKYISSSTLSTGTSAPATSGTASDNSSSRPWSF